MRKKRIDYDTILACKRGDSDAFKRVLEHYDKNDQPGSHTDDPG